MAEQLIRKRNALKGWLTRISNDICELLDNNPSELELQDIINQFENKLKNFDQCQDEIETLLDQNELDEDITESFDFIKKKKHVYLRAKQRLTTFHRSADQNGESTNRGGNEAAILPKIELPCFNGQHTEWQSFWDQFSAVIHNSNLPVISKFSYLRSLLKGEAAASIDGLSLTSGNYEFACNVLKERFGRRERVIFNHIQQLLNMSFKGGSVDSLWEFYDTIQSHVRNLETLEVSGDKYGIILTPLILSRLPQSIRLEWSRESDGKEADLEALLLFLHHEIKRRERSNVSFENPKSTQENKKQKPSVSNLLSSDSNGGTTWSSDSCSLCREKHKIEKCDRLKGQNIQERKQIIMKAGLCFICLGDHIAKNCNSKLKCPVCHGRHNKILCSNNSSAQLLTHNKSRKSEQTTSDVGTRNERSESCPASPVRVSLLQTACVSARVQNKECDVNVLFDSGATRSFISSSLVKKLGLQCVGSDTVSLSLFGEPKPNTPKKRKQFMLHLLCDNDDIKNEMYEKTMIVTETPVICSPLPTPIIPGEILDKIKNKKMVRDARVDSNGHVTIDVLVGLDFFWEFVDSCVETIIDGLIVQKTKFGWMLSGAWQHRDSNQGMLMGTYNMLCRTDVLNRESLHRLWDLESVGISDHGCNERDTHSIITEFDNSVQYGNGRYTVKLPWKRDQKDRLVDNESLARVRLDKLTNKLRRNPGMETAYNEVFHEMENSGIIHEIPSHELGKGEPVFYLPHRPVIRDISTSTKIRPVFDASAKGVNGISLNDCLETGPNLIPSLVEVLLRFRRWRYGLTSDITKAFLQIKVDKADQDVHRFLWKVGDRTRVMRFDRVIFGSVSSPFLLNATVKHHLRKFETSRVVDELNENLYVDDWLSGADTEKEILQMKTEADGIMNKAGFPLAKWGSNCPSVTQRKVKGLESTPSDSEPSIRILGISWCVEKDYFFFNTTPFTDGVIFTKRLILSFIARIFDPLGFLNPFTIGIKILFQELWRLGIGWDDALPSELQNRAADWVNSFKEIKMLQIPRRLVSCSWYEIRDLQLLCFSDASEKAYGCCIYLKVVAQNGIERLSLVASKARVAPLKRVTLPRLELLGALFLARLLVFVMSALRLPKGTRYTCYTDSSIVLHWVKADPCKWKQFIRNRVSEIQDLTSPSNWQHCPGKENPADLLTRGIRALELVESKVWINGPKMDSLFCQNVDVCNEDIIMEEERVASSTLSVVQTQTFLDYSKFSNFPVVLRIIGWVLRFIKNCKTPLFKRRIDKTLDSAEVNDAMTTLIRVIQIEHYANELKDLENRKSVDKRSSLFRLNPYLDENGLMRVGSRLKFAESLSLDEKFPFILPKCHVTLLFVSFQHELMKHAGGGTLIASIRSRYWIVGLRVMAKQVCRLCLDCQIQDARHCDRPAAPLPLDRLKPVLAFDVVGIDHAGPIFCSDTDEAKHYIVLFTCAVVRAVHLELVSSLSFDDFLLAFRKFTSRRGIPSIIYSDNAKTFKAANTWLCRQWGHNSPLWKFSAPLAPWWGGWWERLVRSVKSALRKSLGKRSVSKAELETTLCEVEACVNSRPLTYPEDGNNERSLTPSKFLIGRSTPFIKAEIGNPIGSNNLPLLYEKQKIALEQFWKIWSEDYIRNLPPIKNIHTKGPLDIGSVVLIRDEGKPRLKWPLGVVTKLFCGKDGHIRSVELKTNRGTLVRAIQKLHLLELFETPTTDRDSIEQVSLDSNPTDPKENSVPYKTRYGRIVKPIY